MQAIECLQRLKRRHVYRSLWSYSHCKVSRRTRGLWSSAYISAFCKLSRRTLSGCLEEDCQAVLSQSLVLTARLHKKLASLHAFEKPVHSHFFDLCNYARRSDPRATSQSGTQDSASGTTQGSRKLAQLGVRWLVTKCGPVQSWVLRGVDAEISMLMGTGRVAFEHCAESSHPCLEWGSLAQSRRELCMSGP